MKLEVGSGTRPTPGYLHADINPDLPQLDFVCPMHEIPLSDNTVEEIKSTHCIEHVSISIAKAALKEWCRVLQPNGFAHIDTPNIERNINLYLNGGWERDFGSLTKEEQELVSLNEVPNKTLWLNFKVFSSDKQYDLHYANYDAALLQALCLEAGFSRTEVYQTEPSLIIRAWK